VHISVAEVSNLSNPKTNHITNIIILKTHVVAIAHTYVLYKN